MDYESKLLGRDEVAEGILAVRLAKPEGFDFKPAQWCFLNLPDVGFQDDRGLRRHLSMASSPTDDELVFATKMSDSAFKRTLGEMPLGARIVLEPPRGTLSMPDDPAVPVAYLAGGIGITPFRSLIRHAVATKSGRSVTLFYSNRRPEEAPFLDELMAVAKENRNVRVVATMTRMHLSSRPWDGPTGRLNPEMIQESCDEWQQAHYYLAGPPPMVDAMDGVIKEMGVATDRVHPEKFFGYD